MKKKILKLSLGIFFTFGFCTVTSIRAEEVLVPQVSVVRANYQDGMFSVANLPASCLRTDEQWGKGVWVAQEYESIWGGTEYRTMFLSAAMFITALSHTLKIIMARRLIFSSGSI